MNDSQFSEVKVHNEIELCIVQDEKIKKDIERAFLANRISYFEKWEDPGLLQRLLGERQSYCIICINSLQLERAREVLNDMQLGEEHIKLLLKKVDKTYF